MIVERPALVEELGFPAVEVFRPRVRVHRAPAEADAAPARVADREGDAVAEGVIGRAAIVGFGGDPGGDDQLWVKALVLECLEGPLPGIGRIADLEAVQLGLVQPAPVDIGARIGPRAGIQLHPEPPHGGLGHLGQFRPAIGLLLRTRVAGGHGHPRFAREDFDGLHEAYVFRGLDEAERIALLVTAEAVIEALAIIDVETGGLFLVEGAGRPHVALGLVRLALVPHDLAAHHL